MKNVDVLVGLIQIKSMEQLGYDLCSEGLMNEEEWIELRKVTINMGNKLQKLRKEIKKKRG